MMSQNKSKDDSEALNNEELSRISGGKIKRAISSRDLAGDDAGMGGVHPPLAIDPTRNILKDENIAQSKDLFDIER